MRRLMLTLVDVFQRVEAEPVHMPATATRLLSGLSGELDHGCGCVAVCAEATTVTTCDAPADCVGAPAYASRACSVSMAFRYLKSLKAPGVLSELVDAWVQRTANYSGGGPPQLVAAFHW